MNREQIKQAAEDYSAYIDGNGQEYNTVELEAFMDGAEWRINSVWHDASEEANGHRLMFIESVQKCFFLEMYFGTWEEMRKRFAIKRWAYAVDLLPERKEDAE